jgi:hypothetical protein
MSRLLLRWLVCALLLALAAGCSPSLPEEPASTQPPPKGGLQKGPRTPPPPPPPAKT